MDSVPTRHQGARAIDRFLPADQLSLFRYPRFRADNRHFTSPLAFQPKL